MNTKHSTRYIVLATSWLVPASGALYAQTPLTTGFTYQGQLKQTGVPLTGTADFEFSLWDAVGAGDPPTGGNQVGSTLSVPAVSVSNGLFTTTLDFGVGAMNGRARWLQIGVRSPAGGGAFTTLAPRQAITAAPYAIATLDRNAPAAASSYNYGLLGGLEIQKCVPDDQSDGNPCQSRVVLSVGLAEGQTLWLEHRQDSHPTEELLIAITKVERAGSPVPGFYDVEIDCVGFPHALSFSVSPDQPIYASWNDPDQSNSLSIEARLISDNLLWLTLRPGQIHMLTSESSGVIIEAHVEPYEPASRVVQLQTLIGNVGQWSANYVVTVTECSPTIAPVVAQWIRMDSAQAPTLTFDVRSSEPFTGGEACTLTLMSPDAYIYYEVPVVFPPPSRSPERGTTGGTP